MSHRVEQLAAVFQERIAKFLVRNFALDGALVTVTRVEITPDLAHATAFVGILPDSKRGSALKHLRSLTKDLNHQNFRDLPQRPIPRVHFAIDDGEVAANEVEEILSHLTDGEPTRRVNDSL